VNQNESFTQEIPMPLTSHSEFQSDDMHKSSVCYKTERFDMLLSLIRPRQEALLRAITWFYLSPWLPILQQVLTDIKQWVLKKRPFCFLFSFFFFFLQI